MELIFSTSNKGKVKEVQDILKDSYRVISKDQAGFSDLEVLEDGHTLMENAYKKAYALYERTKKPVIADDTGLFIDALDGRPGLYSARYSGEDGNDERNREKVLKELEGLKGDERGAFFETAIVYIDRSGHEHYFSGKCYGKIAEEEMGEFGFGYDSIFIPKGYSHTFAQIGEEEKNLFSHRAKALRALKEYIDGEEK